MAGRGIGIKVFADLDMAAFAAVLGQMKSAFGRANEEIKGSQAARNQALAAMDKDMVASANRAAWAEVDAQKRAAEQILADRRAANAAKVEEDKRTLAQQRAVLMAPVAQARSTQADKEAVEARNRATDAEIAYAAAASKSAAAAETSSKAFNTAGKIVTGGLVLGLADGIKQTADFSNHLAQMGAATDTTAGQLKQLHDGLMNLGPQVGRSLDEMVSGAYMAAKANFRDTADQINLVRVASQLAAIEGAPLENTMKALTTSLNDFSIPAQQAAKVATMIKTAAGDSKVTLDEFAGSVHNLEPIFKTFVGGNAAAAIPIFGQMNAMLAAVTQTGASADQSSQWLRNATSHLVQPNKGQRDAVGALGGSFDEITKGLSDPNVGPIGAMSYMNSLIAKKLGPDGMVQLDTFYRNKDAINLEHTRYEALSPENKEIADQVQAGTMSKMTALRKASNIGPQAGKMAEWQQAHKEVTGFDPLMKKFGGTEGSVSQAINAMMGSQSGFIVDSALFGNDEAKARLGKILKDQSDSAPENGGKDVGGWSQVADTMGVKTKELQASMKNLAISASENLLPAFKGFVDTLKSISDYFGEHKVLLHDLTNAAEIFSAIWVGSKLITGIGKIGEAYGGLIEKLGLVRTAATTTNSTMEASGAAATRGSTGVVTASAAETAAVGRVGTAAAAADTALVGEGAAAQTGAAGVAAASAEEVASTNMVTAAAERAQAALGGVRAALPGVMAGLSSLALPLSMVAFGAAGDTRGAKAPDGSDPEEVKAKGKALEDFGKDWKEKHGNTPLGGGKDFYNKVQAWQQGKGDIPDELKGYYHWQPGYFQDPWFSHAKGDPNAVAGMPNMPTDTGGGDGTYAPDYMGDGAGGGGDGGGKKKKEKRSPEEVNADLAALGVSPDGTAQDPLYVSDINGVGSGGKLPKVPGEKDGNPFDKFTHPDGLWGKNGLFGDIAGLMTVFLGELALGNPLGKMMEGFGSGGLSGNKLEIANNKAAISANRVQNAFEHLKKTLETHDKDSPEGIIAYNNYKNAVLSQQDQALKGYGASSGRGRSGGGGRGASLFSSLFGQDPVSDSGVDLSDPNVAAAAHRVLRNTGQVPLEGLPSEAAGIIASMFPQIKEIGGTRMPGTAAAGTHEIGRTLDVMMPHSPSGDVTGPGDLELGNQIYGYLAEHAADMGISSMIWQNQGRNFLGGRSGAPGSTWSGQSGHMNHIDVQFMPPGYRPPGGGPLTGPGAIPGPPMTTDANGGVVGHATGTPSIVPGRPSNRDDHLGRLPNGELIGLAGGEGILNSNAAHALGPHIINALNAAGSSASIPGFAGGGKVKTSGPNGPNNPPAPPAGGAAGSTAPPPPKPKAPPHGETPAKPGKSAKPKPIKDQTGSTQDPDETGAKRPGAGISGGIIGAAEGAASAGADMFAPGSGAAVQIGMQELNRAVQWGGEVAATLVGEMPLQTFGLTGTDLSGRSVSLAKSLPGKILGGIMGAHPASNNLAGVGDTNSPDQGGNSNQMVQQGDYTGVHVENMHVNNANNDDMGKQLRQASMSVGGQHWERPTASG